jgi:3-phenylpropionate/trans-cinnamate dioxygenase ferredoxin component
MHGWIRVASIAEIPVNRLTTWETEAGEMLIYHSKDTYFVYPNRCTHQNVPLSDGYLVGDAIVCRLHGAKFDLATGACLRAPARSNLRAYPSTARDGYLFICPTEANENATFPEPMTIRSHRNAQVAVNGS